MNVKLLEVRDTHTFIPVVAVKLSELSEQERHLVRRVGNNDDDIVVYKLDGSQPVDDFGWWAEVFHYISNTWRTLSSGDVVDMHHVRGEVAEPCKSDRPQ